MYELGRGWGSLLRDVRCSWRGQGFKAKRGKAWIRWAMEELSMRLLRQESLLCGASEGTPWQAAGASH